MTAETNKNLFIIDVILNDKGERLKNHKHHCIPILTKETNLSLDFILETIMDKVGGDVVADFKVSKIETGWDGNKIEVGDIVNIRIFGLSEVSWVAEVVSVFTNKVMIETKNKEVFIFDRETGSRSIYDSNRLTYTVKYIEKAGPIEIKEWKENKEKCKIKDEIVSELGDLNLDTLKIIKEIIERDRN